MALCGGADVKRKARGTIILLGGAKSTASSDALAG